MIAEDNPGVAVAVQLADVAEPVDDEAWTEPVGVRPELVSQVAAMRLGVSEQRLALCRGYQILNREIVLGTPSQFGLDKFGWEFFALVWFGIILFGLDEFALVWLSSDWYGGLVCFGVDEFGFV